MTENHRKQEEGTSFLSLPHEIQRKAVRRVVRGALNAAAVEGVLERGTRHSWDQPANRTGAG